MKNRALRREEMPRSIRPRSNVSARSQVRRIQHALHLLRIGKQTMLRQREYVTMEHLFQFSLSETPVQIIHKKIQRKGSCVVVEVGSGTGELASSLSQHCETYFPDMLSHIHYWGIDLHDHKRKPSASEKKLGKAEHVVGDALKTPFPQADIVYSTWSLGYMGHTGFVLRKIARSLLKNGMAVIHINKERIPVNQKILHRSAYVDYERLANNIGKMKFPGCKISVLRYNTPIDTSKKGPVKNDIIVLIHKKT